MSATSASFQAAQQGTQPTQSVAVTITGADVAFLGAGYAAGQTQAPWVNVNITGSGNSYTMVVGVVASFMDPGSYSAAFTVGTANAAGTVLQQQTFTVQLQVFSRLQILGGPVSRSYIFGDATTTETYAVVVQGPARPWSMRSNADWLRVPAQNFEGNQSPNITIDVSGLAPGTYTGRVNATDNADPVNGFGQNFSVTVTAPTFTAASNAVLFGGENGNEALAPVPVSFTLTTGAGVHPYTASVSTDSDGAWLRVTNPTGTVGASGSSVSLSVEPGQLTGATRTGQLQLSTTVRGVTYNTSVPVTWNREANSLVVSESGIALSQVAGRSILSRTLTVFSGASRSTAWTAQSNVPWLTVTPGGTTTGELVITADPGSLALDTTHFGLVTLSSSDPLVVNQPTVRVGLFRSNTAPVDMTFETPATQIEVSPVEPLVALVADGTDVRLYDIYSGTLVRTLSNVVAAARAVTWKGDGTVLYVFDSTNFVVRAINPENGAVLATHSALTIRDTGEYGRAVTTMRPNGREILITPGGRVYNLENGQDVTPTRGYFAGTQAFSYARSPDQSVLAVHYGGLARMRMTALRGGGLEIDSLFGSVLAENDVCFGWAGDRIYGASNQFPYAFSATSLATRTVIQSLPGVSFPVAVACSWNGMVIGGSTSGISNLDLFAYYGPTGASRGNLESNLYYDGGHIDRRGIEISADSTRLITLSERGCCAINPRLNFQMMPTPP